MSAETVQDTTQAVPANWRERLRQVGKEAFIREEMERLGYWPPPQGLEEKAKVAEAQLKVLYKELQAARAELNEVNRQINVGGNLELLILEIRKKRIERVRAERERKKEEKARLAEEKKQQDREWREKTLPHLGRGVSAGLHYEGGDAAKVESLGLPALATAEEVAAAIGIPIKELAWLTYHRKSAALDHYSRFTIPKRSGGTRVISSPKRKLRTAQTWILESILAKLELHDAAMAFRPGRSIVDNARQHVGRAVVLKVDLKDFFPSIRFARVRGMFRYFGYNSGVASILGLLATECPRAAVTLDGEKRFVSIGERQLPQGACTSPAITNILCRRMDARLAGTVKAFGFTYTRYADDLIFSHESAEAPVGPLLGRIRSIIADEGHAVNEEKTRIMRPQHRQAVTGVVVNETPRLSRHDLRRFRAFLHHCETEGVQAMSEKIGKDARAYASGYLSFLHMVNPAQAEKIQQAHPWLTRWQKG